MAWLAGYSKRKPITITGGASGAQTDFQIKLTVTYDGDMQSDFDDLRFTQADGTTLIDAWLETKTDDTSATVWAEFPTTPANTVEQTYYMYYGKVVASDWDGAATFLLFDDFESALSGWTAHAERGATAYEGSYGMHTTGGNYHPAHSITENNICIEAKVKQSGRSGIMVRTTQSPEPSGGVGVGYQLFNKLDGNIYIYEQAPANYIATEAAVDPTTDWYNWKFAIDGSDMKGKYWADGTSEPAWMVEVSDATVASGGIGVYGYSTGTYYDLIRVSKYASNPPTYAFGSEQSAPTGAAPTSIFIGPFGGPFGGPIQ